MKIYVIEKPIKHSMSPTSITIGLGNIQSHMYMKKKRFVKTL